MPATQTDRLYGLTTSVAVKAPVQISADYNITLFGQQSITSTTFTGTRTRATYDGMRVLLINQSNPVENGIWLAKTAEWVRAADFDGARDAVNGTLVFSIDGDCWQALATDPLHIGYDPVTFRSTYPFSGEATYFQRSLRVPETTVSELPPAGARADHILAFNNLGQPIVVLPESGSAADVLIDLASSDPGKGASLVALESGLTVQQEVNILEFARFEQYDQAAKIANILRDGVYYGSPVAFGVMLVGDSTMWGSIPGDTLNQDPKHPGVALKQALDLIYPGNLATVSNNAIPATTLKKMLNGTDGGAGTYADRLAAAANTTIVFCNHCLNDCGSYQSDLAEYRDNLVIFVNTTRAYNKIPVLVTPSLICPIGGGREDQMKRQPAFIQAMRDVAGVMGVDLVDNFYFTERSSELYKPHDIAPDGVHLSQTFYQQAGWNMAIPLLQPHILTDAGNVCGLATSQWADNITTARAIQYQQSSRFSTVLVGDAVATMQAVNYPVVLDRPTKDTVLAIGGRLIANGGIGQITYFGFDSQPQFDGIIDFNGGSVTNYDGLFLPRFCALPAGLSIVGVKISTGISPAPNIKFSFSGVALFNKVDAAFGFSDNTGFQLSNPVLTRNSVRTNMYITQGATILELRDAVSPFAAVITLKWDNALNKVVLLTPAGSTDVWASPAPGQINATLTLNDNRTVTATLGGLTATSPSIGKSAGVLFVGNNVMYSVR